MMKQRQEKEKEFTKKFDNINNFLINLTIKQLQVIIF